MLREDSTQASLEDMLKADLANKGRMNIYRIVIQGTRAPELLLLPERLKSFGYVTEVLDESKPSYDLEALLEDPNPVFLVLEDIQDPGNLGTMLRTGEGAGITAVIMSKKTADLFNPKTIRSTMGSVYRVPFCYVEDLKAVIEKMHAAGIQTYAAHLQGKNSYTQECYSAKTAFLIGNEGNGLSDEIAALAMCKIRIPMEGQVESLNAAVSAAILMYEAKRQNN